MRAEGDNPNVKQERAPQQFDVNPSLMV